MGDAAFRGRSLCSSEDICGQGHAAEPWSRWTLGSSFRAGSIRRGDRPSRPDVVDTSQGTHIDWWIDNFWCLIRSGSVHDVCVFWVSCFVTF